MNDKAKWILFNIFDFGFTWVGSAAVIVYNCVAPDNSARFKLTLGGISLIVALLCTAKAMYEKSYRETYDRYLQQLAEAVDTSVKAEISKKLNVHKQKNDIYQRAMLVMPFLILYIVTYFGARSLESLSSNLCFYSLDNGTTWIDGYVAGQTQLVLNNVEQIKFKVQSDYSHYCAITGQSGDSFSSLYASNGSSETSSNITLTKDMVVQFAAGID